MTVAGPATAFLSLGSNVEPEENLPAAVRLLAEAVRIVGLSRVYETEPVGGPPGQPDFLNAAVAAITERAPAELKRDVLRPIEAELERERPASPYAPRTIDLDLLWWRGSDRTPPDPELLLRRHLAEPLADISPDLLHPETGEPIRDLADRLAREQPDVRIEVVELAGWRRRLSSPAPGP